MKKLKELRTMLTLADVKASVILRKLIVVSLAEIFKDILPGYKIRPWTEKESQQNVSKEVQQLRDYEETLLKQYKLYLDYLNESIRVNYRLIFSARKNGEKPISESDKSSLISLNVILVRCLCKFLQRLSQFNFANEIIEWLVEQLTSTVPDVILIFEILNSILATKKTNKIIFLSDLIARHRHIQNDF